MKVVLPCGRLLPTHLAGPCGEEAYYSSRRLGATHRAGRRDLRREGIAHCLLLGNPDEIRAVAKGQDIELPSGVEILDADGIRSIGGQP